MKVKHGDWPDQRQLRTKRATHSVGATVAEDDEGFGFFGEIDDLVRGVDARGSPQAHDDDDVRIGVAA